MRKGFWIRFLSGIIDGLSGLMVGLLLSGNTGLFFAGRAVVMLKIGTEGTLWKGPIPMILGILGQFVYVLPLSMFLVLLTEPFTGATVGKVLLRMRVMGADGLPAPAGGRWSRSIIKTCGLWIMLMALLLGRWELAVASLAAALVVFGGFFLSLGKEHLAFHDRLSRTGVYSL